MPIFRYIVLTLSLTALTACACPRTAAYEGGPYDGRTAGTGMVEDDGYCMKTIFPEQIFS